MIQWLHVMKLWKIQKLFQQKLLQQKKKKLIKNFYILLTLLLIKAVLLIAVNIYCYLRKYWAQQIHSSPNHVTNSNLKEVSFIECHIEVESNDKFKEINIKNQTCYFFNDIIKIEDFNFDKILLDGKSHINILIYDISEKILIGRKTLRINNGLVRVYDGTRYLVLFGG